MEIENETMKNALEQIKAISEPNSQINELAEKALNL